MKKGVWFLGVAEKRWQRQYGSLDSLGRVVLTTNRLAGAGMGRITHRGFVNYSRLGIRHGTATTTMAGPIGVHLGTIRSCSSSSQDSREEGKFARVEDHMKSTVKKNENESETRNSRLNNSSKLALYAQLAKFRLSALVVATSGAGYLCFGAAIDPLSFAACTVGTALCAGSANSFNQIFERNYDARMKRTSARPLPSGKLSVGEAAVVGSGMGAAGVATLYTLTNPTVAALGAGNILLYAGLYTYSKRKSEWNTWIGSVVGAVPPVMGWLVFFLGISCVNFFFHFTIYPISNCFRAAASGGGIMSADPMMLASILFLWQFPHFFALSWMHREDYARGGFEMVGVNDPQGLRSAKLITEYSLYLCALPIISAATDLTSWMFALEGTAANAYLLLQAHRFNQHHSNANARKVHRSRTFSS